MPYTIPFLQYSTAPFGQKRPGTNDHRGHDVAPGGNVFPSWVDGDVVTSEYHSCLGWVVVVRNRADGYYIGVSHLARQGARVGQYAPIGYGLGTIGNTGSCSSGRHAHITVSPSSRFPWTGAVVDPVAYARNAGGSGGGGVVDYGFGLSAEAQGKAQQALAKLGLYSGPIDNKFGKLSVSGMQLYLKSNGFLPADYVVDGEPGPIYGGGVQRLAAKHGYTGPIDNVPGNATSAGIVNWANTVLAQQPAPPQQADWKAWQAFLVNYGYTGPIDGDPGKNTYIALQQFLAEKFGYTGPIDGEPGDNTWAAFQRAVQHGYPGAATAPPPAPDWKAWQTFLREWGYTGPIDGDPGENTYIALQKFLAAHAGYEGPIDGDPGDFTWAAFQRAVAEGYPNKTPTTPPPPPQLEPPLPGSFFVDVAKFQLGINYAKLKADFVQAGIVKSGGGNSGFYTDAGGVREHVDGFRGAGMFVGHYWVTGPIAQKSAAEQAKFWLAGMYDFRVDTDILMLDNEKLDSGELWTNEDDIVSFIETLHQETGIPYRRMIVYMGAKDWRGHAPWPKLEALRAKGLRFLWAAYGNYPTGTRPDHVPALQGSISDWDIHQYTSTARLGGWTTGLDANYSRIPIEELWKPGDVSVEPEPEPEPCDCTDEVNEALGRGRAALAKVAALAGEEATKLV